MKHLVLFCNINHLQIIDLELGPIYKNKALFPMTVMEECLLKC